MLEDAIGARRFVDVLRDSPLPAVIVDDAGVVRWATAAAERLLDGGPAALAGRRLAELIPGASPGLGAANDDGVPVRTAGGRLLSVRGAALAGSATLLYLEDPSCDGRFAAVWRAAVDALDSCVLLVDAAERVLAANRTAVELLGDDAVDGRTLAELADAGGAWAKARALLRSARAAGEAQASTLAPDGAGRTWEVTAVAPPGERYAVLLVADVTRVVKLQDAIHRSETMSTMGTLVAGVAHEVRNPLFSISATLDAFEARFGDRDDHRPFLDTLRHSTNRLAALTRDLLEYGRPVELELDDAPPETVIEQARLACQPLAAPAGVGLVARATEPLRTLRVDGARILQVLVNLTENAIQHSPPGATVVVEAKNAAAERGRPAAVVFTVADEGPGVPPDDLAAIFLPFFSRRRGGIGLGLAIAQQIVRAHGGNVAAANRPEGGALFTVRLPAGAPSTSDDRRP